MANYVDMNTITLADLLNGFTAILYNAVDNYLSTKFPVGVNTGTGVEKPMTTEELCEYLQWSEPIITRLAEEGRIPRHKFEGVRGYRFFASEVVAALRGQKSLV